MRRSVASQIEYWATLGQIVEYTGLSVQEARATIEQYEARHMGTPPASVDALTARLGAGHGGCASPSTCFAVSETACLKGRVANACGSATPE